MLSGVAGHTRNNDNIAYFDAYLPEGNYCNKQQPITCKRGNVFQYISKKIFEINFKNILIS